MFAGEEIFRRAHSLHLAWTQAAAEVHEKRCPQAGPCRWIDGETTALFAGDGNPLTQCYGLGLGTSDPAVKLSSIAEFFAGRTSRWELILTPYESASVWNQAVAAGLRFDHFENMLFMPTDGLGEAPALPSEMTIELVPPEHQAAWAELSLRAFMGEERPPFAEDLMALLGTTGFARRYWGRWDGEPVAAASVTSVAGTAFLGGMGTLAAFRGRGFQQALLHRRVHDAAESANLALVEALPGSSSHRNAERIGFRVAYTTAVMLYEESAGRE